MIYRLKNDIVLRNALGQQVFRDFVFASKISISASKIIEYYYQIKVPLHEFSYIVLFFQSALNMMEKDNPLVIGFLSGNSNIEKEIYLNELKNEFIKENVEFRDVDKQSADIDLYVSLKRYNDKNTVSILEPNYLTNIKNLILEYKKNVLDFNNYLSEVSILRDIKGDNKEEILKNLVKTLKSNDLLKQGVHSEQDLYPLELGNQVLSLQDYGKIFNKPIFLFVVLRKPVIWDQTTVKVIVLIKTKRDGDHQLHVLCDLLSKWVNDKSAITEFIKETTLENLRKTLLSK